MATPNSLKLHFNSDQGASESTSAHRQRGPESHTKPGGIWRDPTSNTVKTWSVGVHTGVERASLPMCVTPSALLSLLVSVGSRLPETGAKGFGPKDRMGFAAVEFDERGSAQASGAIYRPHVAWGEARRTFHLEQPDERMMLWDGDLHSHPGYFGRPSSKSGPGLGDLGYVEEVFAQNEWMEWFFIPILTGTGTDHVVIHPWVCRRGCVGSPMLAEFVVCEPEEFPERSYNPAWLRSIDSSEPTTLEGVPAGNINGPNTQNSIPEPYPCVEADGTSSDYPAKMDAALPPAAPPVAPTPLTAFAPEPAEAREHLLHEYTRRLSGLISEGFREKTILVVGVGAGSYLVEQLARLTPATIKICDYDTVELANLARTAYSMEDVGALKVQALARRIHRVNPLVEVVPSSRSILEMTASEQEQLAERVDLVIGGTDQFAAQAAVNEISVRLGIPAVFISIHAQGSGGRIVWTVPHETGCYRCVAKERYEAAENQDPNHPLDLAAMVGCVIDGQFIDLIALKIAVAILERGQDSAYGRFYQCMKGRNDVLVRCHPEYEWGRLMWNALLDDLPKQPKDYAAELQAEAFLAMDSLWLKGPVDPECPICGTRQPQRLEVQRALAAYQANRKPL